MSDTNPFDCWTCYDTHVIDYEGAEMDCPTCSVTVKLTGLGHGLGLEGAAYNTMIGYTRSTITFYGHPSRIRHDIRLVTIGAKAEAARKGKSGRNNISSGAIAIEKRARKALG